MGSAVRAATAASTCRRAMHARCISGRRPSPAGWIAVYGDEDNVPAGAGLVAASDCWRSAMPDVSCLATHQHDMTAPEHPHLVPRTSPVADGAVIFGVGPRNLDDCASSIDLGQREIAAANQRMILELSNLVTFNSTLSPS